MSFETSIITGIFAVIAAVLGWFLYRAKHAAEVAAMTAEAHKTEADARLVHAQAEREIGELPDADSTELKRVSIKETYIRELIAAHTLQTEQFTALISTHSATLQLVEELKSQIQDALSLRRFFEQKAKENEKNLIETLKKLESCAAERDSYKTQALEMTNIKTRVSKLERVLTEHKISFEHI